MDISIYNETVWTYPDTPHNYCTTAQLDAARGGHTGIQILGDYIPDNSPVIFNIQWDNPQVPNLELFEMIDVGVNENTDSEFMTTSDYSRCREFVTRYAPFRVYDALRPIDNGVLHGKRFAVYAKLSFPQTLLAGDYKAVLTACINGEEISVSLLCHVYPVTVPELKNARLGMMNFFSYENLIAQHDVKENSTEYWELFHRHVRAQLEMRCTHIMLPNGVPVYDGDSKIISFDFSLAERAGQIALGEGAPFITGTHIAHWSEWNKSDYFLQWDPNVSVLSMDGYLQIKLYFSKWADIVQKNGWNSQFTQALADEPQTYNDTTYRVLAAMFRKFLPATPIIDAVETSNLGGAVDIWVPKQDTYEKMKPTFDLLKASGETMWFYTCAFPSGRIMNRSMDLPLLVSREIFWMGFGYELSGFLHWGWNFYIGDDIWDSACCPHKGKLLPAGDAHIVYPTKNNIWASMRFEAHRNGAEDYELLCLLSQTNKSLAKELSARVCTSFRDYTSDESVFTSVRHELLTALEAERKGELHEE